MELGLRDSIRSKSSFLLSTFQVVVFYTVHIYCLSKCKEFRISLDKFKNHLAFVVLFTFFFGGVGKTV